MTLPFTWTRRGHGRVINWSSFNIVGSQGIGRPRRVNKMGETAGWWSSQNTRSIYFLLHRCSFQHPKTVRVTPNWSQIIITKRHNNTFEIWQELSKCVTERKWAVTLVKMVLVDLLNTELLQTSSLWKTISAKHNKVRKACILAVLFFFNCWDDSVYSFVFCSTNRIHSLFSYWWTWGCFHHLWFRTMFWGTSDVCRVHSGLAARVEVKASMFSSLGKSWLVF